MAWNGDISNAYKENRLKAYFEETFGSYRSLTDAQSFAQQVFNSSISANVDTAVRISAVKSMLSACPKDVLALLKPSKQFVEWLCSVAVSADSSVPLRGLALATISLSIRFFPHMPADWLDEVAGSILQNLTTVVELLTKEVETGSSTSIGVSAADIILHQCVDLLNSGGESRSGWIRNVHSSLPAAVHAIVLGCRDASRAQRVVDTVKIFSMVAEIWLSANKNKVTGVDVASLSTDIPTLISLPASIIRAVTAGVVVHDCFIGGFQAAVDLLFTINDAATFTNQPQLSNTNEIITLALASSFQECLSVLATFKLETAIDVRRVESVVGTMTCFFEDAAGIPRPEVRNRQDMASVALDAISLLQLRLKGALMAVTAKIKQQLASDRNKETAPRSNGGDDDQKQHQQKKNRAAAAKLAETEKELRQCCSEVRKGCIAAASCILLACPSWIVVTGNSDKFWSLCVDSLRTPLLFVAGYKAAVISVAGGAAAVTDTKTTTTATAATTAATTATDTTTTATTAITATTTTATTPDSSSSSSSTAGITSEDDEILVLKSALSKRIVSYLHAALRAVDKYSPQAAEDIIQTVRELCDAGCTELIEGDFLCGGSFPVHQPGATATDADAAASASSSEAALAATVEVEVGRQSIVDTTPTTTTSFVNTLVAAFDVHPKQPKANDDSHSVVVQWKISVSSSLKDIFTLSAAGSQSKFKTKSSTQSTATTSTRAGGVLPPLSKPVRDVFARIFLRDIRLLYRALGISSGPKGLGAVGASIRDNRKIGEELFGTTKGGEDFSNLLLSLCVTMVTFLQTQPIEGQSRDTEDLSEGSTGTQSGQSRDSEDRSAYQSLAQLLHLLQGCVGREVLYEDEAVQISCEIDLIARISLRLFSSFSPAAQQSPHTVVASPLPAVTITPTATTAEEEDSNSADDGNSGSRAFLFLGVRSLSSILVECFRDDGKKHRPFADMLYQAAREALLFMSDELTYAQTPNTGLAEDTHTRRLHALLPVEYKELAVVKLGGKKEDLQEYSANIRTSFESIITA